MPKLGKVLESRLLTFRNSGTPLLQIFRKIDRSFYPKDHLSFAPALLVVNNAKLAEFSKQENNPEVLREVIVFC